VYTVSSAQKQEKMASTACTKKNMKHSYTTEIVTSGYLIVYEATEKT